MIKSKIVDVKMTFKTWMCDETEDEMRWLPETHKVDKEKKSKYVNNAINKHTMS